MGYEVYIVAFVFLVLVLPFVVRIVARSWFDEKRRHLREQLKLGLEKENDNE